MINTLILRIKKIMLSSQVTCSQILLGSALLVSGYAHAEPAQEPLFLTAATTPVVMFAMSRDHELYKKAYSDYTNMDGGVMTMRDITYNNAFSYYGYFDSGWCYKYENKQFNPELEATNHQCDGHTWSGNFLNWAAMTRIDILRRVLYGGKRSTDTDGDTTVGNVTTPATVLERSFIPSNNDAFSKVYNPNISGNESGAVNLYTPYDEESISLCNVTTHGGGAPLILVAKGSWYNWANSEIKQCQWDYATTTPKTLDHKLGELTARVAVCVTGKDATANRCRPYANASKPVGILQEYESTVHFGLVTGTWQQNKSSRQGGVLRKKAGYMAGMSYTGQTDDINEYDTVTGVFNSNVTGIIGTIDRLQFMGYTWASKSSTRDWGNPIGEIYAETLRYLAGTKSPTTAFGSEFGAPSGLPVVSQWNDPLVDAKNCTRCSVIVISSGPNSWDGNDITDDIVAQISGTNGTVKTKAALNSGFTDKIGTLEFGNNKSYSHGGTSVSNQCAKTDLAGLSALLGLCPEEPMMEGSYAISGLAYMAKKNGIRSGSRSISTYAIELSQGLPQLSIPVAGGVISIVPICTSGASHSSASLNACALASVRVESSRVENNELVSGSYLFYWEDNDQHNSSNDYDMDAVQRVEFCVERYCDDLITNGEHRNERNRNYRDASQSKHSTKFSSSTGGGKNQLRIINSLPYWATSVTRMNMSYLVSGAGSTADGLQKDQWVTRGGHDPHNLGYSSSIVIPGLVVERVQQWFNTMSPDGTDHLPADTTANSYLKTKQFTVGATSVNQVKSPLYYAAKYGSYESDDPTTGGPIGWDLRNNSKSANDPEVGIPDGIPDAYFSVHNPALLESRLRAMIGDATKTDASATSVATNSTRLTEGSKVYQAMFNSEFWTGELSIFEIDSDNKLQKTNIKTEASGATTFKTPAARDIYTLRKNEDGNAQQVAFLWSNMTDAQKLLLQDGGSEALGEARVNWLRGDKSDSSGLLRSRELLLGDIVNSTPVISGRKNARYSRLAGIAGQSYQAYQPPELLFVGANDGKLHAFNPTNLNEVYAYVPNAIYDKLAKVTSPNYGVVGSPHQYLVDGPLFVGDAYLNNAWRTIVVGTFGAGARGLYALDVTNDEPSILFEYTEADYPQLGYMLGQAQIAPLPDGTWAVLAGNGYHYSGSPSSQLVVINLETKAVTFIDTGAGKGLSEPALLPNTNGLVEYAYAGDLDGNLWKFDLTGSGIVAYSSTPLFTAKDANGNAQPISTMPTLGLNPLKNNAVMVYFGTGKYFDVGDNVPTQIPIQSFYAIADTGTAVSYTNATRSTVLHAKTLTQVGNKRTIGNERNKADGIETSAVDWTSIYGWHLDFTPAPGERVIVKPQLVFDRLIFTTLTPTGDPCKAGGESWLMELVAVGNKNISHRILDEDVINTRLEDAVVSEMGMGIGGEKDLLFVLCDVRGECEALPGNLESGARGRMSWKQLD